MISYYFKSIRTKDIQMLDEYRPGAWVSVEHPTEADVKLLAEKFNLDLGNLEDALDEDEMPRLERDDNNTFVFVRHVHSGDENEPSTSPVLFVIGPDLFLTVAYRNLPRLERFMNGKVEFATTQRTKLFLLIMDGIVDEYESFINKVSRRIQVIRGQLRSHNVERGDFVDFVVIEDELNEFLSALQPMSAMLRRLSLGRHFPVFEQDQDLIEDLLLNNEQSIEACLSNIKTIVNIREAYSTIASNELNRTMKLLTIATVLIALPNVFFGMYGMNVTLPFADQEHGYFIVVGVTLLVMFVTIIIARVKKIF